MLRSCSVSCLQENDSISEIFFEVGQLKKKEFSDFRMVKERKAGNAMEITIIFVFGCQDIAIVSNSQESFFPKKVMKPVSDEGECSHLFGITLFKLRSNMHMLSFSG